jgi:hypothetical protein
MPSIPNVHLKNVDLNLLLALQTWREENLDKLTAGRIDVALGAPPGL